MLKFEYLGFFMIFNEFDEKLVFEWFFFYIKEVWLIVIVMYNGDFFDWFYVEVWVSINGIDMY